MGYFMKNIIILGSTGSVGIQALDIVRYFPKDLNIVGLVADKNIDLLNKQISEFRPDFINCHQSLISKLELQEAVQTPNYEMISSPSVDLIVVATPSLYSLKDTLDALNIGKTIALASKEIIVSAQSLLDKIENGRTNILPVDSEPSAIWQCIEQESTVEKIIITASGGSLRNIPSKLYESVTPKQVLNHPTWSMGNKITIDSATFANKAFEVIESKWLFDLAYEKISVLVHPQSIVHSIVEFTDGSLKAQLASPDMRLPIQYALLFPERKPNNLVAPLNLAAIGKLEFQSVDNNKYPCFELIVEAGKLGKSYPATVCAADNILVNAFLEGKIKFTDIAKILDRVINGHKPSLITTESIIEITQESQIKTIELITN